MFFTFFLFLSCSKQETPLQCSQLDRAQCMNSSICTLSLSETPDVYLCQEAQGICEEGIVQSDLTDCENIEGCMITSEDCYCGCKGYGETSVPDGEDTMECNCMCSGGEPPSCVPQE